MAEGRKRRRKSKEEGHQVGGEPEARGVGKVGDQLLTAIFNIFRRRMFHRCVALAWPSAKTCT